MTTTTSSGGATCRGAKASDLFLTGDDVFKITPRVHPVWAHPDPTDSATWYWVVKPKELGYVLGPLAVAPLRTALPLPVRIEAMVYAQNGSWFVLPGPWFSEDPDGRLHRGRT